MCRPAFNMCYGSFGPELSGEQPFQCQPAEVHPKGEVLYKWKPFLELLSQVVCENATTFASSGSTWNSMVSFCCVLTMYRSDYLS